MRPPRDAPGARYFELKRIRSGGAGGIFAPALFIGGALGGAIGLLDVAVFGHPSSSIAAFALVGMITLDDLTVLASEPELAGGLTTAADVMRPPTALREHDTPRTAYDRMASSGLRELPVVDAGRRVVGLVNEVAIARADLQARHRPALAAPEQ